MKNIVNIIKYSLKEYKVLYMVETLILFITFLSGIFKEGNLSTLIHSASIMGISIIIIIINTVAQVVLFTNQIKKEQGALLFTTPIKGIEFIVAKAIEVIGIYLAILVINIIYLIIKFGFTQLFMQYGFTMIYGVFSYIIWIVVLLFFIPVVNSYISKSGLRVLVIILLETIGMSIYSAIVSLIVSILPYVNIVTNSGIRYNLVEIAINIAAIITLGIYSSKRIDNNLNII